MPECLEERGHGAGIGVIFLLLGVPAGVLDGGAVGERCPFLAGLGAGCVGQRTLRILAALGRQVLVRAEEKRGERRVIGRDVDELRNQAASPGPVEVFEIVGP